MRILKAQLFNPKTDVYTDIHLRSSHEEIEDALHIVGGTAEECASDTFYGMIIPDNGISLKEQLSSHTQNMDMSM